MSIETDIELKHTCFFDSVWIVNYQNKVFRLNIGDMIKVHDIDKKIDSFYQYEILRLESHGYATAMGTDKHIYIVPYKFIVSVETTK